MRIDDKMEKLRDALNSTVDVRDLCNINILVISRQMDDLIIEYYREQERKRKDTERIIRQVP